MMNLLSFGVYLNIPINQDFPESRYIVIDCMASPVNVFYQIEKILAISPEFNRP